MSEDAVIAMQPRICRVAVAVGIKIPRDLSALIWVSHHGRQY